MVHVGKLYDALRKTAAKHGVSGINVFRHRVEADGSHLITVTLRREDVEVEPPPRRVEVTMGAGLSTSHFMPDPTKKS